MEKKEGCFEEEWMGLMAFQFILMRNIDLSLEQTEVRFPSQNELN